MIDLAFFGDLERSTTKSSNRSDLKKQCIELSFASSSQTANLVGRQIGSSGDKLGVSFRCSSLCSRGMGGIGLGIVRRPNKISAASVAASWASVVFLVTIFAISGAGGLMTKAGASEGTGAGNFCGTREDNSACGCGR